MATEEPSLKQSQGLQAPKHQPLKHILSSVYLLANPSHIVYREACCCWCGGGICGLSVDIRNFLLVL